MRVDALTWRHHAACQGEDPALFFPDDITGVNHAKTICARCPVQPQCLVHAITNREDNGIWGGCSERERRRILKNRREQVA